MSTKPKDWPPAPYNAKHWPDSWLRFEEQFPGSGRPSRLVAHATVPYVVKDIVTAPDADTLGQIASDYLTRLEKYLRLRGKSLNIPAHWESDTKSGNTERGAFRWLGVWPPVDDEYAKDPPQIDSWNLSRNPQAALPATIIMVSAGELDARQNVGGRNVGLRVPMLVETRNNRLRVTIRSMTAEYPAAGTESWSASALPLSFDTADLREKALGTMIDRLTSERSDILAEIGEAARVVPSSIRLEDLLVVTASDEKRARSQSVIVETLSKARGAGKRFPNPLSYQVRNLLKLTRIQGQPRFSVELLHTESCALVTEVAQGEARIFPQTPPASPKPDDPSHPNADYRWSMRRPTREDHILDRFRETAQIPDTLSADGFDVRLCPEYVPQDVLQANGGKTIKTVQLPGGDPMPPRRNDYSAISAYKNCTEFFDLLDSFGIIPASFVVRADTKIQIFYRYGITPGPGKDGRTVNAQVAYDCRADGATRPPIRMNLALAELSRWDRPLTAAGKGTYAQPLGIAMDKRWMLHEFGHYLLAARIGKLEFDFAHSAGDAMAAIACDPASRLADPRNGVAESMRGVTYPFVFSTRRHDRSPSLGWAWYGALNRSVVENPPTGCDQLKGYLTEQILSSSLFRLYRALGGDTMSGSEPDVYMRRRASFLTLFLLIRAIAGFAQSPSKAEMLELGMEDASLLQAGDLLMVPQPTLPGPPVQPDGWKGGTVHKVVRWAFETQGMFPKDVDVSHNGMGEAPAVDIYVEDRRPLEEVINQSRFRYGPGSYCPVSLDWTDTARWMTSGPPVFGNRGSEPAVDCTLRVWIGIVKSDPTLDMGLNAEITWFDVLSKNIPDIAAGAQTRPFQDPALKAAADRAKAQGATRIVFLYEITCPNDRANTDKDANLAVAVTNTGDLPKTARALTDLVANDNNLGLSMLTF